MCLLPTRCCRKFDLGNQWYCSHWPSPITHCPHCPNQLILPMYGYTCVQLSMATWPITQTLTHILGSYTWIISSFWSKCIVTGHWYSSCRTGGVKNKNIRAAWQLQICGKVPTSTVTWGLSDWSGGSGWWGDKDKSEILKIPKAQICVKPRRG